MTMWRITVAPIENTNAWDTYIQQGIIAIGWPSRTQDDESPVLRFRKIQVGDLVVVHLPASHGGGDAIAAGVGRIMSAYSEVTRKHLPKSDGWNGAFRRQYSVKWLSLGYQSLSGILNYYRGTVYQLAPLEEKKILDLYHIML